MKILKKLLVMMGLAALPATMSAQDENFYIFLCIGQSNMVGQGEISDADLQVSDRFLSLSAVNGKDRKRGQWRKAVPPLCREDTKLSLVDYFGRTMLDNLPKNARVGVIHIAVDGCGIDLFDKDAYRSYIAGVTEDWKKREIAAYDNNPYGLLIQLAEQAMDEGEIRGILIHQGETDAYDARWLQKVRKIYNDIIRDLDLERNKVSLLVGEVVGEDQNGVCARANQTINQITRGFQEAYVISSKGAPAAADRLHFNADGCRVMGQRYGNKMVQAMGFELSEHKSYSTTIVPQGPTMDVNAATDDKGMLFAQATEPLKKVEIVSYSGQVLKTIECNGKKTVNINTNEFPEESSLVFLFTGENGDTVSFEMQRQQ